MSLVSWAVVSWEWDVFGGMTTLNTLPFNERYVSRPVVREIPSTSGVGWPFSAFLLSWRKHFMIVRAAERPWVTTTGKYHRRLMRVLSRLESSRSVPFFQLDVPKIRTLTVQVKDEG